MENVLKITVEVDSSNVKKLVYRPQIEKMVATLKSSKGETDYEYKNVTNKEFSILINAQSTGAEFNRLIVKGNKPYKKL